MPRPKTNFPNFKAFGFSIVIHNVKPQAKEIFQQFVDDQKPLWSVLALEPYPDQSGHHLHIFVKWKTQHRSVKWFTFHHNMKSRLILEKPQDKEGDWGRIQVDTLYGDKDHCVKYLVNPDKDKPLDQEVKVNDHHRIELIDQWAGAAARLNRKFIFPETHGLDLITCIEYCTYLERKCLVIPEYYARDWRIFQSQLPSREYT